MGRLGWIQGKPFQYCDSVYFVLSASALALPLLAAWEAKSGCEQILYPTYCYFLGGPNCLRCQEPVTERLAGAALCSHVVPVRPIGHICTNIYPVQGFRSEEATNREQRGGNNDSGGECREAGTLCVPLEGLRLSLCRRLQWGPRSCAIDPLPPTLAAQLPVVNT